MAVRSGCYAVYCMFVYAGVVRDSAQYQRERESHPIVDSR